MLLDLADTLQYVHSRRVICGDTSTRKALLFDDHHIELSDFASLSLRDVNPDLLFACETRYWIPTIEPQAQKEADLRRKCLYWALVSVRLATWPD